MTRAETLSPELLARVEAERDELSRKYHDVRSRHAHSETIRRKFVIATVTAIALKMKMRQAGLIP